MYTLYHYRNAYGYTVYVSSDNGNNARAIARRKFKEYGLANGYDNKSFWTDIVSTIVHKGHAYKEATEVVGC